MKERKAKRAVEEAMHKLDKAMLTDMRQRVLGREMGKQDAKFSSLLRKGIICRET